MIVIYCYLEIRNCKVLKFHVNNFSYFEIGGSLFFSYFEISAGGTIRRNTVFRINDQTTPIIYMYSEACLELIRTSTLELFCKNSF